MFRHVWDSSPCWTINAFAPTESSKKKKTTFLSWGFSELRLLQTTFFVNVYTSKTNNLFTIPRTFAIFSNVISVSLVEIAIKCWEINVFASMNAPDTMMCMIEACCAQIFLRYKMVASCNFAALQHSSHNLFTSQTAFVTSVKKKKLISNRSVRWLQRV